MSLGKKIFIPEFPQITTSYGAAYNRDRFLQL